MWNGGQVLSPPECEEKEEEPLELSEEPTNNAPEPKVVTQIELASFAGPNEHLKKYPSSKNSGKRSEAGEEAGSGRLVMLSPGEKRRSGGESLVKNRNGFVKSQRNEEQAAEVTEIEHFEHDK